MKYADSKGSQSEKRKIEADKSSGEKEDKNEEPHITCNELFGDSKDKESWIQCCMCHSWANNACSEDNSFTCDYCT